MASTRVLVADAGSTDGTVEVALGFRDRLKVEVVAGGLPSVGRNAGARLATTKYVLFLDADVELPEPTLLRRAMWRMERRDCIWRRRILPAGRADSSMTRCMRGII